MEVVETLLIQLGLNGRQLFVDLGNVEDCKGQQEYHDEDSKTGANRRLKLFIPVEGQGHGSPIHVQLVALVSPTFAIFK